MIRIKELRREKHWSQARLAKESGVGKNTIYSYEKKIRNPTLRALEKIANALGCSVKDLVSDD